MTEEHLDAKKWRMFEDGKALKQRLNALEDELKKFAESWAAMGRIFSLPHSQGFLISEKGVEIISPTRPLKQSEAIPWGHLDAEAIKLLLGDFQHTREEFEQKNKLLKPYDIDLSRDSSS